MKKKEKKTNNDLQNTTQKNNELNNMNSTNNLGLSTRRSRGLSTRAFSRIKYSGVLGD